MLKTLTWSCPYPTSGFALSVKYTYLFIHNPTHLPTYIRHGPDLPLQPYTALSSSIEHSAARFAAGKSKDSTGHHELRLKRGRLLQHFVHYAEIDVQRFTHPPTPAALPVGQLHDTYLYNCPDRAVLSRDGKLLGLTHLSHTEIWC